MKPNKPLVKFLKKDIRREKNKRISMSKVSWELIEVILNKIDLVPNETK